MPKINRVRAFRAVFFLVAVALITYCLPREEQNEYSYEVNRPWSYALLTAPFDIPVHMDTVTARELKDSIDREFEPVMRRDLVGEKEATALMAQRLGARDLPVTPAQKNALLERLRQIYDDGIVDAETYQMIRDGRLPAVRFIHDNVAMSLPTGTYRSPRGAYALLDSLFPTPQMQRAIAQVGVAALLQPNVLPDSAASARLLDEAYQRAMAPIGVIQQGERIIDRGDIVTLKLATVLDTYQEMARGKTAVGASRHYYPVAGQVLYIAILIGILYSYLYYFRRDYFDDTRRLLFLMMMVTGFALLAYAMHASFRMGIYLVPFAMLPVMVLIFMDSRTAIFAHTVAVLLSAIVVSFQLEFIFLQFVAGVVAIDSLKELSRRSQLIRSAALVFVAYCLCFLAMEVMQSGTVEKVMTRMIGYFAINALFISFSYILMFIVERVFGFTSRVTLVELSDINNPLLRELSEECPGTFQHSMAVSNLGSAAAAKIGANVQLVRTGALYHDIGKTRNPAFYTENQHGVNPHDALDPLHSARIITGHVREGLAMAEKAKLPQVIKDFITQHHGAGLAKYFYTSYCNAHPDEAVDVAPFSYPGPNPESRETSIMMMADAVEAASRSLPEHTPEAIAALVDKIIDGQIAEGLHNDSPLSFRDVRAIKDVFAQRLRTMYHSRVKYPEMKTDRAKAESQEPQSRVPGAENLP